MYNVDFCIINTYVDARLGSTLSHKLANKEINMTQFGFHTLDLPTLHRHAIGFDRILDDLNRTMAGVRSDGNYPPYNIAKLDDTHYVIEVAVAGFNEDALDIEYKDNILTVKGEQAKKEETPEVEYLHKGISARNFTRTFTLADNVEIRGATVTNGILAVALEHVIPEEKQAKKIAISFAK
jgi:molecular chaperone IbpA